MELRYENCKATSRDHDEELDAKIIWGSRCIKIADETVYKQSNPFRVAGVWSGPFENWNEDNDTEDC